jgi:hypothetical protein
MQDTKKQIPVTMQLLTVALEEVSHQLVDGDIAKIAKRTKLADRTILRYIKEKEVKLYVIGKKILDAARSVIIENQNSIAA